jgi:hypothetical protein
MMEFNTVITQEFVEVKKKVVPFDTIYRSTKRIFRRTRK